MRYPPFPDQLLGCLLGAKLARHGVCPQHICKQLYLSLQASGGWFGAPLLFSATVECGTAHSQLVFVFLWHPPRLRVLTTVVLLPWSPGAMAGLFLTHVLHPAISLLSLCHPECKAQTCSRHQVHHPPLPRASALPSTALFQPLWLFPNESPRNPPPKRSWSLLRAGSGVSLLANV